MIYAAFALALVLIWRSTRIVNFAQGAMAAATAFIALAIINAGYSYWLALGLIWRSARIVNRAQGAMAAPTAFIALAIINAGSSYWLAFVAALVSGFLIGAVVERVVIRPVEGGPELNAVIVTLGLFVAI